MENIDKQFVNEKAVVDQKIIFSKCETHRDKHGSIAISMCKFVRPLRVQSAVIVTFSDASHAGKERRYAQSGMLKFFKDTTINVIVFHTIDWLSPTQKRISCSAYGAEVLARTFADYRGF